MLGRNPQLDELYPLAVGAKNRGESFLYIEMEPRRRFDRFLKLLDGIYGKVIHRRVGEQMETLSVTVQVSVPDILNAKRRSVERGEELLARPLRANQFGSEGMPSTSR